jgi:hypothetical protein
MRSKGFDSPFKEANMGFNVNPSGESKESFLSREGKVVPLPIVWDQVPKGFLAVIWIDNKFMTAAGIVCSERELAELQDARDKRPKRGYLVSIEKLLTVCTDPKFHREFGSKQ